jgi:WD40 repeat protein
VDFLKSVVDIKFSPKHFGLQLATACLDGHFRIYEATDVMNLSLWQITADFETNTGITSICWNPSRIEKIPTIVVGGKDGSIKIYQFNENFRRWQLSKTLTGENNSKAHEETVHSINWAPNLGR